jgi:hypothetical protein
MQCARIRNRAAQEINDRVGWSSGFHLVVRSRGKHQCSSRIYLPLIRRWLLYLLQVSDQQSSIVDQSRKAEAVLGCRRSHSRMSNRPLSARHDFQKPPLLKGRVQAPQSRFAKETRVVCLAMMIHVQVNTTPVRKYRMQRIPFNADVHETNFVRTSKSVTRFSVP